MEKAKKNSKLQEAKKKIEEWQEVETGAVFEIGRILLEVKELGVPHGEWTEWLESVGYKPRSAQRYMQIYSRFNGINGAKDIPTSKLAELLSLPVDVDVFPYIEQARVKSVRELRRIVRESKGGESSPKESTNKDDIQSDLEARIRVLERQVRELARERDGYMRKAEQAEKRAERAEADKWKQMLTGNVGGIPARELLGLSPMTSPENAKKRYRELMHLLHPDKGGDSKLFDVVKKAYDSICSRKSA